jgi:excisionase family DNA binding protein
MTSADYEEGKQAMTTQKNHEPPIEPLLITVKDASRCLGLSRATVYLLIGRKSIPTIRIGRSVRISSQALRLYVSELEADAAAAQADGKVDQERGAK